MAFTSTIKEAPIVQGNKRVSKGTFTNTSGSTGGDINTGLAYCENLTLQHTGSAVVASAPVVNEDFSNGAVVGSAVTIVTVADADGIWIAEGY